MLTKKRIIRTRKKCRTIRQSQSSDRLRIQATFDARLVKRLTDQCLDSFRYIGVRSLSSLVLSGHSELIECVFLELLRQRVAGAWYFVLGDAVAFPLRRALHSELYHVVENLRSAVTATTKATK